MKKLFTILAIIASVFAILFSVLPISNLAIFPAIAALIFGVTAFYLSKKAGQVKKIIQFTFILTIIALSITTYKAIFTKTIVENTDVLDAKETQFEEDAIEELEGLEIESTDIDSLELENIELDN
ncbi:FUSC family protein [Mariniflexile jejuense]|uniref:FUSC family protein n=1 Tax=Mariniflexile jejuense TaxID=1173582 RepID=A0ABW3JKA8_9FLAO